MTIVFVAFLMSNFFLPEKKKGRNKFHACTLFKLAVLSTVFPLFVPAGTILFFKFSRKKYQAKQCQKVRVQFKGVYNSRACTIRGNTVCILDVVAVVMSHYNSYFCKNVLLNCCIRLHNG